MDHIIVEMPINDLTEQWALAHYPHLAIQNYSEKRNKYLLLSRSLLQFTLQTFYEIKELPKIGYLEHGKPYFIHYPNLAFNISHTDESMVIIASKKGSVGIDIETIKTRRNFSGLEGKVLDPIERNWLSSQCDYLNAFFTLWSAKEAYLKATGQGLTGLATLKLDLENKLAFGTLNNGYLYIQKTINKKSFVCYLANKALPNLYQFDGNELNQLFNEWIEIKCIQA